MTAMTQPIAALTIRRLDAADRDAVDELAGRDSRPALEGSLLGAEVAGRLVAAVSISTGESVADPFTRTAEVRSLLEAHAEQLRDRRIPARRRGLRYGLRPRLSAARAEPS